MLSVREQVDLAIRNYENLPAVRLEEPVPEAQQYLATPDRLAYALGWIAANAIVGARYADSLIDALPIYHPEHGWDRFLLTRRVSAQQYANERADKFGLIMLSGEGAPLITKPSGAVRLALGPLLREDPDAAIAELLALFPPRGLPAGDPGKRWKDRQQHYPRLYAAITELVLEHPGLVPAREIFIDDQPVDGAYHPLYLHAVSLVPAMTYDFWLVQYGERAAFMRVHGGQSIYETERKGWSTVKKQLMEQSHDEIKARILAWLRIAGEIQPRVLD